MYKVLLYSESGGIKEYSTPLLQYAKRYADLYRSEYAFVELLCSEGGREHTVETFGPADVRREAKKLLRREGIRARNSLTPEERGLMSAQAAEKLVSTGMFRNAGTVLIYRHTKAELSLDTLPAHPLSAGKRFAYPLCISGTEMIALIPDGEHAWKSGYCGIPEPDPERSEIVTPEEIDLVICPCSAFDEGCRRMGMGAGFYDRYLPKCVNAHICAAAFEVQKLPRVPADSLDVPMEMVFTEKAVYYYTEEEK